MFQRYYLTRGVTGLFWLRFSRPSSEFDHKTGRWFMLLTSWQRVSGWSDPSNFKRLNLSLPLGAARAPTSQTSPAFVSRRSAVPSAGGVSVAVGLGAEPFAAADGRSRLKMVSCSLSSSDSDIMRLELCSVLRCLIPAQRKRCLNTTSGSSSICVSSSSDLVDFTSVWSVILPLFRD